MVCTIANDDFTATINGCAVDLANNSTNASQYYWTLGDGATANTANLSHVYTNGGTKDICLYAMSATCDTVICQSIFILGPTAAFTQSINGYTVSLINNSSDAQTYYWTFGDGTNDTSFSPTHIYSTSGTKNICLTALDSCLNETTCNSILIIGTQSLSNQKITNIHLYPNPTQDFLHISAENLADKKANLILFNSLGQIVWQKEVFIFDEKIAETIDLQSFAKGLYSFLLQTEHTFQVQNVMKE